MDNVGHYRRSVAESDMNKRLNDGKGYWVVRINFCGVT